MSQKDDRLVSLGDALLRVGDRQLLDGEQWLNDQVIGFWFEHLAREVFPDQRDLLLVGGTEAFAIMNCGPEAAPIFLEPRQYHQRQLVLLAVSNNPDVQTANGGSHWSLLVHWRPNNVFLHYDSAGGMNSAAARQLYGALRTAGSRYKEAATPEQRNGYECGLVVLAIAQLLCNRYAAQGQQLSLQVASRDLDVDALRQHICQVIDSKVAAQAAGGAA